MTALLGADGPESVMNRTGVVDMAGDSLRADYDRYLALSKAADDAQHRATAAATAQQRVAAQAKAARAAAAGAAQRAESLRASVATRRAAVVQALARAEHTSVALAAQRQAALEEIARRKAEAEARRKAAAAAKKAQQEAAAQAAAAAAAAAQDHAGGKGSKGGGTGGTGGTGGGGRDGDGPGTPAPPAPAGSAGAAIAFAKAQLGEPYLWGAAGPNRWDCSGLTMMAWRAGGISLPHFSGAQYDAGTPIPVSQARAGDLLFWSSNGRPSGIHHVALALGGGQFIEAPHPGANVRYNSIYEYYPNFAVRL
jgi:cell wall-associated NlpC family hydrolase